MPVGPTNFIRGLLGNFGIPKTVGLIDRVSQEVILVEQIQPFLGLNTELSSVTDGFTAVAGGNGVVNTTSNEGWAVYQAKVSGTLAAAEYIRLILTQWQSNAGSNIDFPITDSIESSPSRAVPAVAGRSVQLGWSNYQTPIILLPGQAIRATAQDIITAGTINMITSIRFRRLQL